MELKELLVRLPEGSIADERYADATAEVYNLSFLTPHSVGLRPDVLYFGDETLISSNLSSDQLVNLVMFGCEGIPRHLEGHKASNVIVLSHEADPFACYNALQNYFIEDIEVTNIVRRMLSAHFSNNGLQHLVEEASRALDNPILVVDSAYHYIASHLSDSPAATAGQRALDRQLQQELDFETILEPGVSYIRDAGLNEKVLRARRPLLHYHELLQCNTMISAVTVHGICIAHVMMLARNHEFRETDTECFARLTLFVGQEMQKASLYETSQGQMESYFLVNLLNDDQPSCAVIERRLKVLGWEPLPNLYVAVCESKSEDLTPHDLDHIASQLSGTMTASIYASYEGRLVILFSRDAERPLGKYTEGSLREVAALNNLVVGVSNMFTDLTDIRNFYHQALAAIKFGELVSVFLDDRSVHHYRDYAYAQMLDITNHRANLLNFCHPALRRVMDYDQAHDSELMDTLFIYLQNSGNTRRSAKMLSLHKNTLLYRMGRIREILGCDLSSGEDCFMLQVSFRVLLYLDLFKPRVRLDRSDLHKSDA